MKSRLSLIFAALVVVLGAMLWVVQDRKTGASAPALEAAPAVAHAPISDIHPEPAANEATAAPIAPAARAMPVAAPSAPQAKAPASVQINADGHVTYVARAGDTVSDLAIALLGSDSKERRDAVIAANSTLQTNPDLVLAGQIYVMGRPLIQTMNAAHDQKSDVISTAAASAKKAALSVNTRINDTAALVVDAPKLKYSAQPGDTVRVLAASFLGGDTKANRDSIIRENTSLQQDPNHLVAGRSYTISAPNGLAAGPAAPLVIVPTSQPDSDDILQVGMGRTLRYRAQSGDTVSKLAVVLMGSDMPANRELIVRNNPSLKQNPNHLTAGRTYWIAAPNAYLKQ